MLAAVVSKPGVLEVIDIPLPRPGPYDCLVKIDACAICTGTDSHIAFGKFPWRVDYPFILGHESTGAITEVGSKVKYFKLGQRVTRPTAVPNNERINGLGSNWGGFAEWGIVRDTRAAAEDGLTVDGMLSASRNPLPGDVDPISAALSINQREILSVVIKMHRTHSPGWLWWVLATTDCFFHYFASISAQSEWSWLAANAGEKGPQAFLELTDTVTTAQIMRLNRYWNNPVENPPTW